MDAAVACFGEVKHAESNMHVDHVRPHPHGVSSASAMHAGSTRHASATCCSTLASPGRGRGCSGEHDPGMLLKMIYVSPRIEQAREGVQCLLERCLTCANPDELRRNSGRTGVDGDLSLCERRTAAGERRARPDWCRASYVSTAVLLAGRLCLSC